MTDLFSQEFHVCASLRRKSQAEKVVEKEGCFGLNLTVSLHHDAHVLLHHISMPNITVLKGGGNTTIDRI